MLLNVGGYINCIGGWGVDLFGHGVPQQRTTTNIDIHWIRGLCVVHGIVQKMCVLVVTTEKGHVLFRTACGGIFGHFRAVLDSYNFPHRTHHCSNMGVYTSYNFVFNLGWTPFHDKTLLKIYQTHLKKTN